MTEARLCVSERHGDHSCDSIGLQTIRPAEFSQSVNPIDPKPAINRDYKVIASPNPAPTTRLPETNMQVSEIMKDENMSDSVAIRDSVQPAWLELPEVERELGK